jgi:hypothetical protein
MQPSYTDGIVDGAGIALALARQPALDETECPYHLEHAEGLGKATATQQSQARPRALSSWR